mmetsp:Transcript_44244/g.79382  ORF Transcript_44244/g.79382 Transcript_44244/m.79382 type:complete len:82 (-) Transcript_44244:2074-2319(-)
MSLHSFHAEYMTQKSETTLGKIDYNIDYIMYGYSWYVREKQHLLFARHSIFYCDVQLPRLGRPNAYHKCLYKSLSNYQANE